MPDAPQSLASRWWSHHRLSQGSREDRLRLGRGADEQAADAVAAYEQVAAVVEAGGSAALELIWSLVETAESEEDLAVVGAGPLEDLVVQHAESLAAELADLARRSPRVAPSPRSTVVEETGASEQVRAVLAPWLGSI